jgi:hypothetical protein
MVKIMERNIKRKSNIEIKDSVNQGENNNMPNGGIIRFITILVPAIILGILGNTLFGAEGAMIGFLIGLIIGAILIYRGV